jgi:hypothetical protein
MKNCVICNTEFESNHSKQVTCLKEVCQKKLKNKRAKERRRKTLKGRWVDKKCIDCSISFLSYLGNSTRCKPCAKTYKKQYKKQWEQNKITTITKTCKREDCNNTFEVRKKGVVKGKGNSLKKWCSNNCSQISFLRQPKNKLNMDIQIAVRKGMKRIIKHSKYFEYLDFTMEELRTHLEKQFDDWMNWDNHGLWHIDHIRPVASFDFTSMEDEDFKKCWALENLQPLKDTENMRKNHYYNKAKEMKI